MAVPVIVKLLTQVVTDKRVRKVIIAVILAIIMIIPLLITLIVSLLSGLGSLLEGLHDLNDWNNLKTNVQDIFTDFSSTVTVDIKSEVYDFMPDFSVNLSKAAIATSYDNLLLAFDTAELDEAYAALAAVAGRIRAAAKSNPAAYAAYAGDNIFMSDVGITKLSQYTANVRKLLNAEARKQMTSCDYEYTQTDAGTIQRLTVTTDGRRQIVEYNCTGGKSLYIPALLAMYTAKQTVDSLSAPAEEQEAIINNSVDADGNITLFQTAGIAKILRESITDGMISTDAKLYNATDYDKLTVSLIAPSESEWFDIFGIEGDAVSYYTDYLAAIESTLDKINVPDSDRYLDLDGMFQSALFIYFEGFFNLPVNREDLRAGTNGLLSVFGDYSDIHMAGRQSCFEEGITLDISSRSAPVMIDLLPSCGDCFDDIVIYDVWEAESHPGTENNYLYGGNSVTVAYYIDVYKFRQTYGFDFPVIISEDGGSVAVEDGDVITMLVEYSCLSDITVDESCIGNSILDDVAAGGYVIGYCHSGTSSAHDLASGGFDYYYHEFLSGAAPHMSVQMDFYADYLNVAGNPGDNGYNGLSGHTYNARINPLLWFKSFRTEDVAGLEGLLSS